MATQHRGTITTWKDDKGFGFITPDDGGTKVFFHVSGLVTRQTRPSANVTVRYTLIHDEQQRPRAINVRLAQKPRSQIVVAWCVVGCFFIVLALATLAIPLTPLLLILYTLSSAITYWMYARDKASAVQGAQRIPENVLHLLELVGGWPGALAAQEHYRHKTVKVSYQVAYWIIVIINLAFLIGYGYLQLLSRG